MDSLAVKGGLICLTDSRNGDGLGLRCGGVRLGAAAEAGASSGTLVEDGAVSANISIGLKSKTEVFGGSFLYFYERTVVVHDVAVDGGLDRIGNGSGLKVSLIEVCVAGDIVDTVIGIEVLLTSLCLKVDGDRTGPLDGGSVGGRYLPGASVNRLGNEEDVGVLYAKMNFIAHKFTSKV